MAAPSLRGALLNDPEHWRQRAEEARVIAADIADAEAKRTMLGIAAGYERLAERADARLLTQLQGGGRAKDSDRKI